MNQEFPFLPIATIGELVLARHTQTLDIVLVIRTAAGAVSQSLSDEHAINLGLALIRESEKRSQRTEAVIENLQRALKAQEEKKDANQKDTRDPVDDDATAPAADNDGVGGSGRGNGERRIFRPSATGNEDSQCGNKGREEYPVSNK
jgi:hypothetical protein